ncbi:MAG: hypothetical protein J1E83_03285 [Lachnospiraceae bacterium]|nr:hypothetical protein [Lachnospiraceae bacterium]
MLFNKLFHSEYFNIHYEPENKELVELLSGVLLAEINRIMKFFKLTELKSPKEIFLYAKTEEYAKHISRYVTQYQDWMVADTYDGNIHILSLDGCRSTNAHKKMEQDAYAKIIIHEFVHACQQEINPNAYGCQWFWEALATNLSGQVYADIPVLCDKEQLMFYYESLPDQYPISYHIGKYMLEKYSHEKLLEYVYEPEKLREDVEEILRAVKETSE